MRAQAWWSTFCTCFLSEKHLELLSAAVKNNCLPAFEKMRRYLSLALLSVHPRFKWISPGRALTKAACHYTCINQVASKQCLKCHAINCSQKMYKNHKIRVSVSKISVTWILQHQWRCTCQQNKRIVRIESVIFYHLNNALLWLKCKQPYKSSTEIEKHLKKTAEWRQVRPHIELHYLKGKS